MKILLFENATKKNKEKESLAQKAKLPFGFVVLFLYKKHIN